jgi:hypothetical protein
MHSKLKRRYSARSKEIQRVRFCLPPFPVFDNFFLLPVPEFVLGSSSDPPTRSGTPSSAYFTDADYLDDTFLHQLDQLESQLNAEQKVSSSDPSPPLKRRRLDSSEDVPTEMKFDQWAELIGGYEDEISCPMYVHASFLKTFFNRGLVDAVTYCKFF